MTPDDAYEVPGMGDPGYPDQPPGYAFEMTSGDSADPVYVANEAWTRGQARAYMAGVLECAFTEVSVTRIAMVWDPRDAASQYREIYCNCGAKVEEKCACPWPGLDTFWDESGTYCPWREVPMGTPGATVFWHGEVAR